MTAVLYTIVSEYDIFYTPSNESPSLRRLGSVYCEGLQTAEGFRINRLISTNPADYLNPAYAVGACWQAKPGKQRL